MTSTVFNGKFDITDKTDQWTSADLSLISFLLEWIEWQMGNKTIWTFGILFYIYDLLSNKNLLLKHCHLDLKDSSLVCSILIPDRSLKISRMGVSHKISTVTCYQCDDGYKCDISLKTMWQYYETSRLLFCSDNVALGK